MFGITYDGTKYCMPNNTFNLMTYANVTHNCTQPLYNYVDTLNDSNGEYYVCKTDYTLLNGTEAYQFTNTCPVYFNPVTIENQLVMECVSFCPLAIINNTCEPSCLEPDIY
jgi:hypothetical protein